MSIEGAPIKTTYIYPIFTWPNDPRCAGAYIDVVAQDGTIINTGVFGRQLKADGTNPSNWFPTPKGRRMVKVRFRSYADPGGTPTTDDDQINSYVPGVTPEVEVEIGDDAGVLNLATATPETLTVGSFASGIRPVLLFAVDPALPNALYPKGTVGFNTTAGALKKVNAAGNAWEAMINGGKDIQAGTVTANELAANSVIAGKIAAGAVSTAQLSATEFVLGPGGGTPPRFRVNDSLGNMIAFIGVDAGGSLFNWFKNIRIGPDINNPTIYGSGSGVQISGASFTLNLNGISTSITNFNGGAYGYVGLQVAAGSARTRIYKDRVQVLGVDGTSAIDIFATNGAGGLLDVLDGNGTSAVSIYGNPVGGLVESKYFQLRSGGAIKDPLGYQLIAPARGAAVADPSGGSVVDTECRAAVAALLSRIRTHGLIAT